MDRAAIQEGVTTRERIFPSPGTALRFIRTLIAASTPFEVVPLPDDEWLVTTKEEVEHALTAKGE